MYTDEQEVIEEIVQLIQHQYQIHHGGDPTPVEEAFLESVEVAAKKLEAKK